MADRGIFGLLGILALVAIIMFLMTPQEPGSTGQKVRDTVRREVHETADRLGNAFEAARKDVQREGNR
ncbi:MAG: hypothetical protein ACAH83_05400 [Alphaproteobacteria bacterium]